MALRPLREDKLVMYCPKCKENKLFEVVFYMGDFNNYLAWVLGEDVDGDEFIALKSKDMGVDEDEFITLDACKINQKHMDEMIGIQINESKFRLNVHNGVKNVTCHTCAEAFYLNNHWRIQVNGKTYHECPHCEYLKTGVSYW